MRKPLEITDLRVATVWDVAVVVVVEPLCERDSAIVSPRTQPGYLAF